MRTLREMFCMKSLYDIFKSTQEKFYGSCRAHTNHTIAFIASHLSFWCIVFSRNILLTDIDKKKISYNTAGYTAELVACCWAGAELRKPPWNDSHSCVDATLIWWFKTPWKLDKNNSLFHECGSEWAKEASSAERANEKAVWADELMSHYLRPDFQRLWISVRV